MNAEDAESAKSTTAELLALLDYAHGRLVGRLAGLPVAEYLWEPVAGCWSVRAGEDGVFRAEKTYPDPDPAPFTTIAWRVWHIADCLLSYSDRFWEGMDREDREWPGTPEAALAGLNREWDRFRGHVAAMDEAALGRPLGPAGGPYAKDSYHALVLHALDEVIHHGAEIGVLRDLYRASAAGTAWTAAR
jgi:uncharacterized damage-inducible protein DinB